MKSPPKSRYFLSPNRFFLQSSQSRPPAPQSTHCSDLYLSAVCFSGLYNGIIQNVFFSVQLIWFNIMSMTPLHIAACYSFSFPGSIP